MKSWILDESGEPKAVDDTLTWAKWFETAERHVADETIGDSRISTVFLGIDHGFGHGEPVLWETMVFGGSLDGEQDRCAGARLNASAMHERMVIRVREAK